MGIFISAGKTAECVVVAVLFSLMLALMSLKPLGVLQSLGYRNGKTFAWLRRKNNMAQTRLNLMAFASVLSCAVLALCFSFAGQWAAIISLAAYAAFFALYLYAEAKVALKTPLSLTPRIKRLVAVVWLLCAVLVYITVTLLNFADYVWGEKFFSALKYCVLAVYPVILYPLVALANLVSLVYEAPKNKSYIKKAKAKLASSQAQVIAVTGSYGKTTAKNILNEMLKEDFTVLATPRSFNTPLGIAKTLNGADLDGVQVFIAEMGARKEGDVAELCALCPPDYSLITGICNQHLESFKTVENIVKAKGEIIAPTKNKCFVASSCYERFAGQKVEKCDCVSSVTADCTGTEFTLTLGGESARVKTKLLGAHSADNIGLCACVAYEMGVPFEHICRAIEALDFVEHRLQLIESNGVHILDDGYNSNVVGAEAALQVLKTFGGRKICVTPGIVELGVLEESENKALGEKLVGLDLVILVGETLVTAVKNGYLQGGGEVEKLVCVPTLAAAQNALKDYIAPGDAVLFLNDLPAQYL